MTGITPEDIEAYAAAHSSPEPPLLATLAAETYAATDAPGMMVGPLEGRFLEFLVFLSQARLVVEIGTFTGYSALSMAPALPPGGRIVTCDIDPDTNAIARRHAAASPWADRIEFRLGPALETLATLDGPFDLVFIDADKTSYQAYYEAVLPKLADRGVIVVDNVLWSGRVLRPPTDDDRRHRRHPGLQRRGGRRSPGRLRDAHRPRRRHPDPQGHRVARVTATHEVEPVQVQSRPPRRLPICSPPAVRSVGRPRGRALRAAASSSRRYWTLGASCRCGIGPPDETESFTDALETGEPVQRGDVVDVTFDRAAATFMARRYRGEATRTRSPGWSKATVAAGSSPSRKPLTASFSQSSGRSGLCLAATRRAAS